VEKPLVLRCRVTVWEPGASGVPYEYEASPGCEVEHGKALLFQNEVRPGADVEFQVEIWNEHARRWDVIRKRANRTRE